MNDLPDGEPEAGISAVPRTLKALAECWYDEGFRSNAHHNWWYLEAGRQAIRLGSPDLACEILLAGLERSPADREMRYQYVLALLESGSLRSARNVLESLEADIKPGDAIFARMMGLKGRLLRDCWLAGGELGQSNRMIEDAERLFERAYRIPRDYSPGLNAAASCWLQGKQEEARALARSVLEQCRLADSHMAGENPKVEAAMAGAQLLLGDPAEAEVHYRAMVDLLQGERRLLVSVSRQLRRMAAMGMPHADRMLALLPDRTVLVFVGHMIDAPGRDSPRFPAYLEDSVREALTAAVDRLRPDVVFCSLACGADLLFFEVMAERDVELNVFLPFDAEDFKQNSVTFAGPRWEERFDRAMSGLGHRVRYAVREASLGTEALFDFKNRLVDGLAMIRARQLDTEPTLLALMEPGTPPLLGGVADSVRHWNDFGRKVEILDLSVIRARVRTPPDYQPGLAIPFSKVSERRRILTMLFADMVGFSKLQENDAPRFLEAYLALVDGLVTRCDVPRERVNTWGDGLFVVFDDTGEGADFALKLRDAVRDYGWQRRGFGKAINVRVGVHTGPVLPTHDPAAGRTNYFGTHVNRAARIEPVVEKGQVWVSEPTAAILADMEDRRFVCEYLGKRELAKEFGREALYRLEHAGAS